MSHASQRQLPRVYASALRPGFMGGVPRALLRDQTDRPLVAAIMAQTQGGRPDEVRGLIEAITESFQEFKASHEAFRANAQAAIDDQSRRISGLVINGGGAPDSLPPDPEYSRAWASYFRSGTGEDQIRQANAAGDRAQIRAAMNVGSNPDGGYLAPVEWDRRILQALQPLSPMRRLATVVQTGVGAYSTVWSDDQFGSGWVGETASRPNTTTPQLSTITFTTGELYAAPTITMRLLDDSALNMEAWLAERVGETFARAEGIAFLAGSGINQPTGLLTYVAGGANAAAHPGGAIATVNTGSAAAITGDGFVDLAFSLGAEYRAGAAWLMNSTTAAAASKLKDGQGNYLWRDNYQLGVPQTLLGYPVEIDENMPSIVAGNIPVIFGNFKRGYVINDRLGTRVLRDPYTMRGFVSFVTWKRVGAGLQDPKAFRALKVSA